MKFACCKHCQKTIKKCILTTKKAINYDTEKPNVSTFEELEKKIRTTDDKMEPKNLVHTHRNFVGASNLLWGLVQPNTDLVESTLNFGRANPHFWSAQPKNDEGCGNQIFGWSYQNFWLRLPNFFWSALPQIFSPRFRFIALHENHFINLNSRARADSGTKQHHKPVCLFAFHH